MAFNFSNQTVSQLNGTNTAPGSPDNVTITSVSVVGAIAVVTFLYNSLIVAAFVKESKIRTPFNYYILNLTAADLSIAVLVMPIFIRNRLVRIWPLSREACTFFLNSAWVCTGAGAHAVMWISLDRTCSLYFPVWHKNTKSNKLTLTVSVVMWIYLVVVCLPYTYMDQYWYLSSPTACRTNVQAQPEYLLVLEVILYILPIFVVLVCYILIIYKIVQRKKSFKRHQVGPVSTMTVSTIQTDMATSKGTAEEQAAAETRREERKEWKLLMALVWIAVFMILLWSPAAIYYIMASYIDGILSNTAIAAVLALEYLSCVINPLIYHRKLPDIHKALNSIFRCS